ncbi:hypothetical protein R1sor_005404 [Riccia sorocarpa]|uniref:Retrotransposon gag domain-containing protein n=1 Tax=Riccia sorocarpa TaxID=122646 RepID=A0ABD3HK23_9MARC
METMEKALKLVSHFADDGKLKPEHHLKNFEVAMRAAGIAESEGLVKAFSLTLRGEAVDFIDDMEIEGYTTRPELRAPFLERYKGDQNDLAILRKLGQVRQKNSEETVNYNHRFKQEMRWLAPREQESQTVIGHYLQGLREEIRSPLTLQMRGQDLAITDLFPEAVSIQKALDLGRSVTSSDHTRSPRRTRFEDEDENAELRRRLAALETSLRKGQSLESDDTSYCGSCGGAGHDNTPGFGREIFAARKFSMHFKDIVAVFRELWIGVGLEMATSSRGDKGKAPMVEHEDIGTEEGELLDVHPPLPEPVGRSGSDRKRKKPAREEEGPLAVALLPPTAEEKRAENARKKAEKDENYRQNSIFRHRWFVWFTQETNNQTPLEKRFFTPGSLRGIQNFRSHLMELAIVRFLEEKEKPDVRPWETSISAISQRLARFLEEVLKNWDKHYDVWLKSREFEIWTEDAPPKSIKDHACTSAKYKACKSMSDNTIRFISKDNFTRMDETTRLDVGGAGRSHRVGVVDEKLVPVLGADDVVHYALKIWHGEKGDTKVHEKCIREMMAILESHPAIIRPIDLSKDKKRPMLLFPLWNGGTLEKYINLEKRSRG